MSSADAERSAGRRGGAWRPFLAGAAVVLVASLLPVPDALVGSGGGRGGGAPAGLLAALGPTAAFHLIGYAGLAALATRATGSDCGEAHREVVPDAGGAVVAAGASVAVGLCAELLQAPLPWRSVARIDAAVNAAGAVVGVAAVSAFVVLRRAAG